LGKDPDPKQETDPKFLLSLKRSGSVTFNNGSGTLHENLRTMWGSAQAPAQERAA